MKRELGLIIEIKKLVDFSDIDIPKNIHDIMLKKQECHEKEEVIYEGDGDEMEKVVKWILDNEKKATPIQIEFGFMEKNEKSIISEN